MFGSVFARKGSLRPVAPRHLARARRRLVLLSCVLTCAVLVACLAGAWGIAAYTSRRGSIAAMSDVVVNSLELTPQALQGGEPSVERALQRVEEARSQEGVQRDGAQYAGAIMSEDRTSPALVAAWRPFVLLELADGTVKFAIAPQWGDPDEFIMSRGDAVQLAQSALETVCAAESDPAASRAASRGATHEAQAGPTTWLWSTYMLCVNPKGMGNPGGDVVSFNEDGDLGHYGDEGMVAARAYVFVDQTPALASLSNLAITLASIGVAGCALLVFVCHLVVSRALQPAIDAWRAQQSFVGRASHELKTPLASLTSSLDVLDAHADQTVASQGRWVSNMREDVDQMATMACTLLSALDSGIDVTCGTKPDADADTEEL